MLLVYGTGTDHTDKYEFLSISTLPESTSPLPLNTDCVLLGVRTITKKCTGIYVPILVFYDTGNAKYTIWHHTYAKC